MRTIIVLALFASVALAGPPIRSALARFGPASLARSNGGFTGLARSNGGFTGLARSANGGCKPDCVEDCMGLGSRDEWDSCMMVFGMGPLGPGWYSADDSGRDNLRTCRESCEAACENICMQPEEGRNEQIEEDRGYGRGYRSYGYGRRYGGYGY